MKSIITICSMLLITITATPFNTIEDPDSLSVKCKEVNFEDCTIINLNASKDDKPVNIDDLYVYEVEEEVYIDFDTAQFLPEGFNPLKGLGDLDWTAIELIELEEEVTIDFDTKKYLPEGFNALKGMGDLDWATIELVEIEEEVTIPFDTKQYLPEDFNPIKGIGDLDWSKIELIEIEEEVEIDFDTKLYLPVNFNDYKTYAGIYF
jgi:hypothetical protein